MARKKICSEECVPCNAASCGSCKQCVNKRRCLNRRCLVYEMKVKPERSKCNFCSKTFATDSYLEKHLRENCISRFQVQDGQDSWEHHSVFVDWNQGHLTESNFVEIKGEPQEEDWHDNSTLESRRNNRSRAKKVRRNYNEDSDDYTDKTYVVRKPKKKALKVKPEKYTLSCSRCDFVTEEKSQLGSHFVACHEEAEKKLSCSICDFVTEDKNELGKHLDDHKERVTKKIGNRAIVCSLDCEICSSPSCGTCKNCTNKKRCVHRKCKVYLKMKRDKKRPQCPLCLKTFSESSYLSRHLKKTCKAAKLQNSVANFVEVKGVPDEEEEWYEETMVDPGQFLETSEMTENLDVFEDATTAIGSATQALEAAQESVTRIKNLVNNLVSVEGATSPILVALQCCQDAASAIQGAATAWQEIHSDDATQTEMEMIEINEDQEVLEVHGEGELRDNIVVDTFQDGEEYVDEELVQEDLQQTEDLVYEDQDGGGLQCSLCEYVAGSDKSLTKHMQNKHKVKQGKIVRPGRWGQPCSPNCVPCHAASCGSCKRCVWKKRCINRYCLKYEMIQKKKQANKKWRCKFCHKRFIRKNSLELHIKRFQCKEFKVKDVDESEGPFIETDTNVEDVHYEDTNFESSFQDEETNFETNGHDEETGVHYVETNIETSYNDEETNDNDEESNVHYVQTKEETIDHEEETNDNDYESNVHYVETKLETVHHDEETNDNDEESNVHYVETKLEPSYHDEDSNDSNGKDENSSSVQAFEFVSSQYEGAENTENLDGEGSNIDEADLDNDSSAQAATAVDVDDDGEQRV